MILTGGISIFINQILCDRGRILKRELSDIDAQLAALPDGKLICSRNGSFIKWYVRIGNTSTYLPKTERTLAEQLAVRKYLSLKREELLRELKGTNLYLQQLSRTEQQASHLLEAGSPYLDLLSSYFSHDNQELAQWAQASFERNGLYPEQCIHQTSSGNRVRSKSEAIIDLFLYSNRIPFRYECALHLDSGTVYPDFTIRHPVTGSYYYWEHLGMMDESPYYTRAFDKLKLYAANRIVPGQNLILTSETKDHPLSTETVKSIISTYFLC